MRIIANTTLNIRNLVFKSQRGLTRATVEEISAMKHEPEWMKNIQFKAYDYFL